MWDCGHILPGIVVPQEGETTNETCIIAQRDIMHGIQLRDWAGGYSDLLDVVVVSTIACSSV